MAHKSLVAAVQAFLRDANREMVAMVEETGNVLLDMHKAVVSDWSKPEHKPNFRRNRMQTRNYLAMQVNLGKKKGDMIYRWIDKGTKPYMIPKFGPAPPGKPLRFRTGYEARTLPIAKYRQGRGIATGPWVSKYRVRHPGIAARKFTETFNRDIRPVFRQQIDISFQRLARKYS